MFNQLIYESVPVKEAWYTFNFESYRIREGGPLAVFIPVEGDANDTRFHPREGKGRVVARPMKFFERHLETHGFLRVPRAFRINPNYVIQFRTRSFDDE